MVRHFVAPNIKFKASVISTLSLVLGVNCSIQTFKILNSVDDINSELFFQMDDGARRGHDKNCLKRDKDLMYENMF